MRRLVDTHIALWVLLEDPRLSDEARRLILDPDAEKYVSVISLWEIGIKHALPRRGASHMPVSARTAKDMLIEAGFRLLSVEPEHALALDNLPIHHGDPFDRLLVAQAIAEPMLFLTHDRALAAYSDLVHLV